MESDFMRIFGAKSKKKGEAEEWHSEKRSTDNSLNF
jgi:hypothetical protein